MTSKHKRKKTAAEEKNQNKKTEDSIEEIRLTGVERNVQTSQGKITRGKEHIRIPPKRKLGSHCSLVPRVVL